MALPRCPESVSRDLLGCPLLQLGPAVRGAAGLADQLGGPARQPVQRPAREDLLLRGGPLGAVVAEERDRPVQEARRSGS